jgi:hypothetical protein
MDIALDPRSCRSCNYWPESRSAGIGRVHPDCPDPGLPHRPGGKNGHCGVPVHRGLYRVGWRSPKHRPQTCPLAQCHLVRTTRHGRVLARRTALRVCLRHLPTLTVRGGHADRWVFMVKPPKLEQTPHQHATWKIILEGLLVGVLTGLVGVGGGFLIVPALVLLGGLPIHLAIGSSLLIIALKSFSGFAKYLEVLTQQGLTLDWTILLTFVGVGVIGILSGGMVASRLDQNLLQKLFAGLLFLMGTAMLVGILL